MKRNSAMGEALDGAQMIGYDDSHHGEVAVWYGGTQIRVYSSEWKYGGFWSITSVDFSLDEASDEEARERVADVMESNFFTPVR